MTFDLLKLLALTTVWILRCFTSLPNLLFNQEIIELKTMCYVINRFSLELLFDVLEQ